MMSDEYELLTAGQVAEEFGVFSEARFAKMRSEGQGPVFEHVGDAVLYRRCDVEDWFAAWDRRWAD